jgi:hypothetical protein
MNRSTTLKAAVRTAVLAAALTLVGACKDGFIPDQNNPGQSDFSVITSRSQLQAVALRSRRAALHHETASWRDRGRRPRQRDEHQ